MKENNLDETIANEILKDDIKNYKEYIVNYNKKDDFELILIKRYCHFPPCLNKIIGSYNYCHLHNENSI